MKFISSKSKNQMRRDRMSRIQIPINLLSQSRGRVNEAENKLLRRYSLSQKDEVLSGIGHRA
ncbi:hypothetical protein CP500_021850 [Tychonema bourrellyi FEM_GT703]|uniref:Uncharacterized protein n=1 Tax=Tychonema bourrellyi FEM_GT703 TaxID=2040638 RepID=A0A2G4EV09_9CYAN|nr:hypothetical protein CP500_021850 [Tychonema bourrellyi FEM_GT703]